MVFALEGVAMTLWLACRDDPMLFVLLSGVVFFGWGEIFSLFPSTLTDTFGSEYASSNYGWLYISQGIGSIFGGPLAALLYQHTQGWEVVFSCAIGLDFITAALAIALLKPWRARFIRLPRLTKGSPDVCPGASLPPPGLFFISTFISIFISYRRIYACASDSSCALAAS